MKIDAATAPSDAQPAEPENEPGRKPVPRPVYVAMRLEEISAVVDQMAKDRDRLTVELKASPGEAGAKQKGLRLRRAYVAERLSMLRKEQSDLKAEKKILGGASPHQEKYKTNETRSPTMTPSSCLNMEGNEGRIDHRERSTRENQRS